MGEWIPVTEELPVILMNGSSANVLVTICLENFAKYVCIARVDMGENGERHWVRNYQYLENVVAWMSLPFPYEGLEINGKEK